MLIINNKNEIFNIFTSHSNYIVFKKESDAFTFTANLLSITLHKALFIRTSPL